MMPMSQEELMRDFAAHPPLRDGTVPPASLADGSSLFETAGGPLLSL